MNPMKPVRVYRNVNARDKFLGMELADGCLLALVFVAVFTVNKESLFLNGAVLAGTYFGLRALKRGKPDGYVAVLGRHLLSPRFKGPPHFERADRLRSYGE